MSSVKREGCDRCDAAVALLRLKEAIELKVTFFSARNDVVRFEVKADLDFGVEGRLPGLEITISSSSLPASGGGDSSG